MGMSYIHLSVHLLTCNSNLICVVIVAILQEINVLGHIQFFIHYYYKNLLTFAYLCVRSFKKTSFKNTLQCIQRIKLACFSWCNGERVSRLQPFSKYCMLRILDSSLFFRK